MNEDEFLNQVFEKVHSYLDNTGAIVEFIDQSSLRRTSDLKLPLEGLGLEKVLSDLDYYLSKCVNTAHPGFMNPFWGGLNSAAFVGEIIASLTNTSMYTFELAPLATLIEQALIKRMSELVGYPDGNGTLTTGGSNGNMLGMMCGRYRADPLGQRRGFDGTKLAVYVSEESHYSVMMSANVLGIGFDNVIKIPCDADGRMRSEKLQEEIDRSRREGFTPVCVVATSGTTVRGAFDPIKKIADICSAEDIWLHVDAAWGGSCLFSSNHRSLMEGIELADSVCWDAHKMMGIPMICSAFLIKDPKILRKICSHTNIGHYLFQDEAENVDLGRTSLQCGRRNDALKLFFAWREIGDAGWAKIVDDYMDLAAYFEKQIISHPNLELASSRQWTNLCLRYTNTEVDLDQLNTEVRKRIMRRGKFMISKSTLNGQTILRPVISNPMVSRASLDELIGEINSTADDIIRGIPQR
ncbi:MAG TPA: glutamate decarboxylase [Candidatus Poseidoniales archaeon]|jgi:glutamate/tyrosine decarboxylase-like PLP-dependent enzyme|nr:MAG: glutamate decarboxylase [Euryarchaeota archaeon]HIF45214.1 glutamate decarboxylase [Candidatus Poseidoniales archaeon]HIL65907.1 glutamate decarboxylase [Candidatus Poseidoniales archaeon]